MCLVGQETLNPEWGSPVPSVECSWPQSISKIQGLIKSKNNGIKILIYIQISYLKNVLYLREKLSIISRSIFKC